MPISGSTALAVSSAPAITSSAPYKIYTVTNATGIFLAGFTIINTGNIPQNLTIYQDNLSNAIYSVTLASLQGTPAAATAALQVPVQATINGNLMFGETLLALSTVGGLVSIEVDGILSQLDPQSQYLLAIMYMMNQAFGVDIPNQQMLNAAAMSLT